MKKTKLFILCCFYMVTNAMFGSIFTVDGIKYQTLTTTTVQISSYETLPSPDFTVSSTVRYKGQNYKVVKISWQAFHDCTTLASVTIEKGITEIDEYAFMDCENLMKVTLPEGLKTLKKNAFWSCDNLVSINLPSTLTEIGHACFAKCKNLQSDMIVPSGVNKIEGETFSGCNRITKISLPETITEIGSMAFQNCYELKDINIPSSVHNIGSRAFEDCHKIKTIIIPNGVVTQISSGLFNGCNSLKSVQIPASVNSIGGGAFSGCSSLTSVSIPDNVLSIGDGLFRNCTNLQSINISSNSQILTIGSSAFSGCSSLTSIYIPKGVDLVNDDSFSACTSLSSYNVHPGNNTYTAVEGVLFKKDKKLLLAYPPAKENEQYVVPIGVEEIANNAFKNAKIRKVSLPNTLKNIGENAFYGTSLMYVTIPKNVEEIGNNAFSYCNNLDAVMVLNNIPPDIYSQTFKYSGDIMLFLDEANLNTYKNAFYWRDFKWIVGFPTRQLTEDLLQPTTIRILDVSCEYGDEHTIQYKATGGYFEGEPQIIDYAGFELSVQEWPIYIYKGTISKKNLTLFGGTLTVTKAPLVVGVQNVTIVEGDPIPAFTLTYDGFKNNDIAIGAFTRMPVATTTATSISPAGTYPIIVSGGASNNYELCYTVGTLTITPSDGISDTSIENPSQHLYDLQGHRIEHLIKKGVYITEDGKKVYVQ